MIGIHRDKNVGQRLKYFAEPLIAVGNGQGCIAGAAVGPANVGRGPP